MDERVAPEMIDVIEELVCDGSYQDALEIVLFMLHPKDGLSPPAEMFLTRYVIQCYQHLDNGEAAFPYMQRMAELVEGEYGVSSKEYARLITGRRSTKHCVLANRPFILPSSAPH
jgi:hypothetical protein